MKSNHLAYLPGTGVNADLRGRSPRASPFHCTSVGMTLAIIPNVDDSGALFLVVEDCVRALLLNVARKVQSLSTRNVVFSII